MYIMLKTKYFGVFIAKSGFGLLCVLALLFILEMDICSRKGEVEASVQRPNLNLDCSVEAPQVVLFNTE